MAKQLSTFLFIWSLLAQTAYSNSELVDYFDHYSFDQGISQGSINCMVRDLQGYLWVGTQGGLNRFNGLEFKAFVNDGSNKNPSGNWITGCEIDAEGNLWFSTKSAGVNKYSPTEGRFYVFDSANTSILTDDRFNSLYLENEDFMWAGGANGEVFKIALHDNSLVRFKVQKGAISKINRIVKGSDGKLWLATASGLYYLANGHIRPVENLISQENPIDGEIWTLAVDHLGDLWIGGKTGLYQLTYSTTGYKILSHSVNAWVTGIIERESGELWLTTYGDGLLVFSKEAGVIDTFVKKDRNSQSLNSDYLISIYKDSEDQVWIGSDGKGLQRYLISRNKFHHTLHDPDREKSISHAFVRAITTEKNGTLWIGTRNGLNRQLPDGSGFVRYFYDENRLSSLPNNNVFALHVTRNDAVWIGTYGGGLARYNPATDDFTRFTESSGLPTNYIYAITSANDNTLWLGTNKGLVHFDPDTGNFRHFQAHKDDPQSLSQNTVISLLDDGKETLWVGTFLGLNKLDKTSGIFTQYKKSNAGLSDNVITSLILDAHGDLWVGTMDGLNRLDRNSQLITQFGVEDGLPNGNVFGIIEDNDGNLWLSTNNGLAKFNVSEQSFGPYSVKDGLQDRAYILGALHQDKQGNQYFGGVNGYNKFLPETLATQQRAPSVVLEDFLLFNKAIDEELLSEMRENRGRIELSYKDAVFGVTFSTPLAVHPEKVQFAYRLNGFDTNWITTTSQSRVATYTNIPAGEFELEVRARYAGEAWGNNLAVPISVKPAPWFSAWAIILYILLSSALMLSFWLLHRKKKFAEQQKRNAEIAANAKDELLANVSHEFKTPITLILGPTNELLQTSDGTTRRQLEGVKRNAEKLNLLVNNILDSKTLSSDEKMLCSNLTETGLQIINEFAVLAKENEQQLDCVVPEQQALFVDIEPEKIEQLISNLLSNAIKYAGKHCGISLRIWAEEQNCFMQVKDTGVGIPESEQRIIFERGCRGSANRQLNGGHGIGLALVKEIIEQANGAIKLTSGINEGASFLVTLPLSLYHRIPENGSLPDLKPDERGKKLLIIDDNAEIRLYLSQILADTYQCQMSSDGKEGLSQALEWQPDVIISDVMMPNMNGLALLKALRTNEATCHIPVLMLSAYPSKALKLNTLSLLADEFLPKPFDKAELFAALNNILAIRAMSQQRAVQLLQQFGEGEQAINNTVNPELPAHNGKDTRFIEQVNNLLNMYYADTEFSLTAMAEKMFMSERNLQIKTKALFGVSPVDLIRDVRLHQATQILCQSDVNIGQVTLLCGFNSQSYFSKCFKEKYGMTPNAFRKSKQ